MIYRPNSTMTIGELIDELECEVRFSGVPRDTPIHVDLGGGKGMYHRITGVPETPDGCSVLIKIDESEVTLYAPHV